MTVPPSRHAPTRQRIHVELPCKTIREGPNGPEIIPKCIHQGVCTIEEQIEQDLTLIVDNVGRPVRLFLGCSAYSKLRGPRPREVTDRIRSAQVAARAMRTAHPRSTVGGRQLRRHRAKAQPLDKVTPRG